MYIRYVLPRFYPSTFVHSPISPKIQFYCCLFISVSLRGGPMVDTRGKNFLNMDFQITRKCIFLGILELCGVCLQPML